MNLTLPMPPKPGTKTYQWMDVAGKVALTLSAPILAFMLKIGWDVRTEIRETQTTVAVLKDRSDREKTELNSMKSQIEEVKTYTSDMRRKSGERDFDFRQIKAQLSDLARRLPAQ